MQKKRHFFLQKYNTIFSIYIKKTQYEKENQNNRITIE